MITVPGIPLTPKRLTLLILAVVLALVPVLSAWDDGGGHRWTQANACKALLVLAALGLSIAWRHSSFRPPTLTLLAMLVWLIAGLQCVPLPPQVVKTLSPASYDAYREWLPDPIREEVLEWPQAPGTTQASRAFPISVAPNLTRQALSLPLVFAIGCWISSICYSERKAGWILLAIPVIAGTVFCFFGSADMIRLHRDWNVELRQRLLITPIGADGPFGPFINNNTCIGYINLCLGCVLGMFFAIWTGGRSNIASKSTRIWLSALAFLFAAIMVTGVLASGSRGGFLGMCFATIVMALLSLRKSRIGWIVLFLIIGFGSTQLLDGLGIRQEMQDRLSTLYDGTALNDGRLKKWEGGLKAAAAHLPLGSGLGTYRYAQMAHGSYAAERWAVNADGMHVEWALEGGVWLLPIILLGCIILVREIRSVSRSTEKLSTPNTRLAKATLVAATFSLASLFVTQSFDFGITHIPLILTVSILAGGVSHFYRKSNSEKSIENPVGLISFSTIVAIFTIAAMACAVSDLDAGGVWQRIMIQRHAERNLPIQRRTLDLDSTIEHVQEVLTKNPHDAMGHRVMALLLLDRQHQVGSESLLSAQAADANSASNWSLPMNVRRAVHVNQVSPGTVMLKNQSLEQWRLARQHAASSLALSPLDDATRVILIETDFVEKHRKRASRELLMQTARLRPMTPLIINHLARLALSYPGPETEEQIREIETQYRQANTEKN